MNRTERERRALREKRATESLNADSPESSPGKASRYIHYLTALVKAGLVERVVLYCRVSTESQERAGHGEDQEDYLRYAIERLGILVLRPFHDTCSGHDLNRPGLDMAIAYALKHDAILVAESTDRFLRPADCHTDQHARPTKEQFEELARLARGVKLATLRKPDAPPSDARSHQSKRGQWANGDKGGRRKANPPGYKKDRREKWLPTVLRMRAEGMSVRDIAKEVPVSPSTVGRWIRKYAK